MRWSVLMLAFLVACGGEEDGDENDPRRFEVSDAEWAKVCPPPEGQPVDKVQYFKADGTPLCWEDAQAIREGCIRYFGGDWFADISEEMNCTGPDKQVAYCAYPDSIAPDLSHRAWECVSYSEAKRRSL